MGQIVFVNGQMREDSSQEEHPNEKRVDKYIYILLAVFAGGVGVHKFYAGRLKVGIAYLLFCWTAIPAILALFDIVKACGKIKDSQNRIWI